MKLFSKTILLISALLLLAVANAAEAQIGKVLLAIGEVNIQRDQLVKVTRGIELIQGDVVITGKSSRAQLLMIDGARIAMKPDSRISLDEYRYNNQPEDITAESDSSMTMSVIKGGFRTISGAIGKGDSEVNYKVKTPVATIGIRGTDYELFLSEADPSNNKPSTLGVGVWSGTIELANTAGSLIVGDDGIFRFAFVGGPEDTPKGQKIPPFGIGDTDVSTSQVESSSDSQVRLADDTVIPGDDEDIAGSGKISLGEVPRVNPIIVGGHDEDDWDNGAILPVVGGSGSGPGSNFDLGEIPTTASNSIAIASDVFSTGANASSSPEDLTVFQDGILTAFQHQDESGNSLLTASGVEHLNIGYDRNTGIAWGRWANGTISIVDPSGQSQSYDLGSQSLHWAIDTGQNTIALPVTGSAEYQLVGNTDPTNNLGDVGVLGSASLAVNFTDNTVSSGLDLSIGGNVWQATGSGTITAGTSLFSGDYSQVLINGADLGSGNFEGFFSSIFDAESGLPMGAGMAYNLFYDGSSAGGFNEIVNGIAIFRQYIP